MVEKYFTGAWEAYKKNALSLALGWLIAIFVPGIIIGIGMFAGGLSLGTSLLTSNPSMLLTGSLAFMVFLLIGALVLLALYAGLIKMSAEAIKGKTSLETMFSTASKKAVPIIITTIVVGIIISIIALIIGGIFGGIGLIGGGLLGAAGLGVIGVIISVLIALLFSFTFHGVVLNDLGAIEAIKNSIKIAKANYVTILVIVIAYTIIAGLVSLIPILGALVAIFLVYPMYLIAFTTLYLSAKKR